MENLSFLEPWQKHCPIQSGFKPPGTPLKSMELLSRSWNISALELSKALSQPKKIIPKTSPDAAETLNEDDGPTLEEENLAVSGIPFSFASSETSQMILDRIMTHSEVSPRTSGRLSSASEQLNGSLSDSPPVSPSEIDDSKCDILKNSTKYRNKAPNGTLSSNGGKTVGRWLKDRKEKKKEETRAHNAQLHAAISVAGLASAVAAIAAATSSRSGSNKDEQKTKTDMAVASAATLVAAQCVEAAETMGAEREHLTSVVSSAVNVKCPGDIMTLTAAAATALRGAATLKARALKEVWNVATVIPVDKGMGMNGNCGSNGSNSGELIIEDNFLEIWSRELLAKGCELLKRTRKGELHMKVVSVYINKTGQVILKMKSRQFAGTITKKKKNVVLKVYKDMDSWPGRHLLEEGDKRRYFGLETISRGLVEFECKNERDYDIWTKGVERLLAIAEERTQKNRY